MAAPRFPYATKSRIVTPQVPLNGLKGANVTASEQTTLPSELSGGQNVFTDMAGAIYARPGSSVLGGLADTVGYQGGWVFRDNEQRISLFGVVRGVFYYYDGSSFVKIPSSPTLDDTLAVNGVFFPEQDKFYVTNGTDDVVELDQSLGSLTATSKSAMQKSLFLGHHQNSLVYINLPGQSNAFIIGDEGAITSDAALSTQVTNGYLLGMASLDAYTAVVVTDQMSYRMAGITVNLDASGNTGLLPGTFNEIFQSRCVAPRSIFVLNNAAYWVGLDAFNTAEIYRCDGQQVFPVAWSKMKSYLRNINTAALSGACAIGYGVYAKFALPSSGSPYNDTELLLDTARSVSYTESGQYGPPQITWETRHLPGFPIAQYATWRTGGEDAVMAFDAVSGTVHRTGTGNFDELPFVDTLPEPGSSPAIGTIAVTSSTPFSQPFPMVSPVSLTSVSLAVTAYATGGDVTFSVEADVAGIPSGISLADATVTVGTTPPPAVSAVFSPAFTGQPGESYHLVVSVSAGTLSVSNQTPAVTSAYLQYSAGTWTAGSGNPILVLSYQASIDASFVHTTSFDQPGVVSILTTSKKKMSRTLVNGISVSGAMMTLGVGTQGRDGTFEDTSYVLPASNALWASASGPQPDGVLVWAAAGDPPNATNSWSSSSPDTEVTSLAPWFAVPSYYVSIRHRCVGVADWRVNSYQPMATVIPTTVS